MRQTKEIPIGAIQMDRWALQPQTLKLAAFLEMGGDVPPIHVARCANGNYRICDGRHRVTAFKLLGRRKITARFSMRKDTRDG